MLRSRRRFGSTSRANSTVPARLFGRKRSRLRQCHFEQLEKRLNLDTYLWHQTAATTFNWTDAGNWTDISSQPKGGYPGEFSTTDVAELTSSLANNANEEIDLPSSTITLATLDIGSTGGGGFYVLQSGGSISLSISLNKLSGGPDSIGVPISLSAGAIVNVASGLEITAAGAISGAGLTKSGAGALLLESSSNSYTGSTTIFGTLELVGDANLSSGAVTDSGSLLIAESTEVGNSIGGSGSVTVGAFESVELVANNTYSGGTTINGDATLEVLNGGSLGSGPITDNSSLLFDRSDSSTVANAISGPGAVTMEGGGTVVLSGANSYSGATTISSGTLSISSDANLGTAPTSATAGDIVLDNSGTLQATGSFFLNSNRGIALHATTGISDAISVTTGNTLNYGGIVASSGTVGLTVTGGGFFNPTGPSTYSGPTTVTGGATLAVTTDANLGAGGQTIFLNNGTLEPSSGFNSTYSGRSIVLGPALASGSGTILVPLGATEVLSNQIINNSRGTGGLILTGGGTLAIPTTQNYYTGGTTISQGTLEFAYAFALGTGPITLNDANTGTSNTALLASCAGTAITNNITVANQGTGTSTLGTTSQIFGSGATVFSGNVTLDKDVTFQDLNPSGTDWNGVISDPNGPVNVQVANGQVTSFGPNINLNFASNVNIFGSGTTLQASGPVTGFGGSGSGWTVNQSGTYSKPTAITGDVLTLTDGNTNQACSAFDSSEVPTTSGFTASFTYTATPGGSPEADGVAFVLQTSPAGASALGEQGGDLGFGGISGPGLAVGFSVYNVGTVFSSATAGGTLAVGTYQSTRPVNLENADPKQVVLTYNASTQSITEQLTDTVTGDTKTITIPNVNLAAIFAGSPAYVGFTGASGGFTATQKISNFSFQTNEVANVQVATGATLELGSSALTINQLSGTGTVESVVGVPATLYVGAGNGSGTFSGTIKDSPLSTLALVQDGTGTLTLSGANTYSGGTTINQGTIQIAAYNALGGGPVTLNDPNTGNNNTALLAIFGSTAGIPNDITVADVGTGTSTLGTTVFTGSSPTVFAGNVTLDEGVTFQGGNSSGTDWDGEISSPMTVTVGVTSASTTGNLTNFGPNANFAGTFDDNINISGTGTTLQTSAVPAQASVSAFGGSGSGWTVNQSGTYSSSTAITNDVLTLTDGKTSEARSAFYDTEVPASTGFTATFTYTVTGNFASGAADGMAFVLQASSAGASALGGQGGSLGAAGIGGPGLAVTFNFYQPPNGYSAGTGFSSAVSGGALSNGMQSGNYTSTGSVALNNADPKLIVLTYNPSTESITEKLTDTTTNATATVTIPNVNLAAIFGAGPAYVGFTGASGGGVATQTIGGFSFQTTPGSALSSSQTVTVGAGTTLELGSSAFTITELDGAGTVESLASVAATLTVGSGTFSGIIENGLAPSLELVENGPGTLILSGTNTYSGGTVIQSGGTLSVSSDSNLGAVSGGSRNIVLNGGTLQATTGFTLNSNRVIALGPQSGGSGGTISVNPQQTLTFGGKITNNGGGSVSDSLTLTGGGTVVLSGSNNYVGTTSIQSGSTLSVSNDNNLGSVPNGATPGSIVINGGTLEATATFSLNNNRGIAVGPSSGSTILVSSGKTLTYGGIVANNGSGAAGLTLAGGGMLMLTRANTYSGTTTISSSTLELASGGTLATSAITDNGSLVFNNETTTASYPINGTGAVTVQNGGTVTLSNNNNSYSGGTTISGGSSTLSVGSDANLGAVPSSAMAGNIVLSGGTLKATAGFTLNNNRGIALGPNGGGGTISVTPGNTLTYGGIVANNGSGSDRLTLAGGGTLVLSGANAYSGGTIISAGTLQVGNGSAASSLGTGSVTDNGSLIFDLAASSSATVGAISGTGSLTQEGSGSTLVLTGADTYTGTTTISAGSLQVGTGGSAGSLAAGPVLDNGSLVFDEPAGTSSTTVQNAVSGTGSLSQEGSGNTIVLTGANSYTGGTTISSGTLQLGSSIALGSGTVTVDGGTLDINSISPTVAGLALEGGSVIGTTGVLTSTSTYQLESGSISADLSGSMGLSVPSNGPAGTVTLSGANNYTGGIYVGQGTLTLASDTATGGTSGITVNSGATLDVQANLAASIPIDVKGSGELETSTGDGTVGGSVTLEGFGVKLGGAGTLDVAGQIADNGFGVAIVGPGTVVFGAANSVTGTATIDGGVLSISDPSNLGAPLSSRIPNSVVIDGGTLLATSTFAFDPKRGIELGGNGQSGEIDVASSQTLTYAGQISDGSSGDQLIVGDAARQNTGTLVLSGANTYTGGTTINASLVYPIASGQTLTLANPIAGSGTLTFQGPGTALFKTAGSLGLTGSVVNNASIAFNATSGGPITVAAAISGAGSVTQEGSAAIILTANNTYSGSTTINPNTIIQVGNGGNTGSLGMGSVVDNGSLVYDTTGSQTLSNLSGTGTLTQSTGSLTLTDPITYTGATTVNGGILTIDGNLGSSAITVNSGGTVTGTGTVGHLTNAGGTVSLSGLHFLTATTLSLATSGSVSVNEPLTFNVSVAPLASLAGAATGTVELMEAGQSIPLATGPLDSSGKATFNNVTFSQAATASLSAVYVPTGNFVASTSSSLSVPVSLYAANGKLTSSDSADVYGESLTLTAAVSNAVGQSPAPSGSVTFYDGSTSLGTVTLSSGMATQLVTSLAPGNHNLSFNYSGDSNFAAVTPLATLAQTVSQDATTSTLAASPGSTIFGQNVTLTATVSANAPGSGTPTGTVTFFDGTTSIGSATLAGGTATIVDASLIATIHSLSIQYSGDVDFKGGSSASIPQAVSPDTTNATLVSSANPSVFGQAVTLTATVAPGDPGPGSGYPTGTVTFDDGSSVLGSASLANGVASINVSALSVAGHSITASFSPGSTDPNFQASTSATLNQTVNQDGSEVTLSEPPGVTNPSQFGQPVTIDVTVAAAYPGSGTPSGSVLFDDGGTFLSSVALSNSTASLTLSDLAAGSHAITASYQGDGDFLSSSATINQSVKSAGSTNLKFDLGTSNSATLSYDPASGNLEITSPGTVPVTAPLSQTGAITITAEGNDSLTIDFTNPFAETINFNGTGVGNTLTISGGNIPADYEPTAGGAEAGTMHVGNVNDPNSVVSTISFTGVSSLSVANLSSFQVNTPAGVTGVTIGDPTAGVSQISGTSAGTAFAPVSFSNVAAVTVSTPAQDTNDDTVMIQSGGLGATGLQSFSVKLTGSGNNMLLDYNDSYNLPVAGGKFTFAGGTGKNTLVGPNPTFPATPPTTVALANVAQSIPVPVVVIPGFTASFATPPYTSDWFTNIGLPASEMALDPIENTYTDLVNTLVSTGYTPGETLFDAPWDWRLPLAPQDTTIDGMLSGLTATELTGGVYKYAVDYLGTALNQAATYWSQTFDGRSLPAVDVITHSTGALLARAYIQSPSYGQVSTTGFTLPEINDAVMIAPPNQGAPQTWNLLNDNYSESTETRGVSLIIGASYAYVVAGGTISSPRGDITLSDITVGGSASIQQFLLLYAPSLEDLLPTYQFLGPVGGPLTVGTSDLYNKLLFDLNDGYGLTPADLPPGLDPSIIPVNPNPNLFLEDPSNEILGKLDVVYSSTENTADQDVPEQAGTGSIVPLGSIFSETPTDPWYMQQNGAANGDGTLTVTSTVGQFEDPALTLPAGKVFLQQLTGGSFIHAQIPSNATAQEEVLGDLGQKNDQSVISTGNSHFDPGYVLENVLSLLPNKVLSYKGLTFDASKLAVAYDTTTNIFTLTGPSSLTIPDLGTIDINLSGPGNGLVMTGEQFTSFGATLTTDNLGIGGLTLNSDGLQISYQAPTGNFVITGDADFQLDGQTVDVTLGGNGTQGLVIQNGQFVSLDMTVDSTITIGGASFTSQGLNFTYDTASSQFTMTGDATLALGDNNVSVDFGGGSTQGLVVTNGSLSSFDASITSNMSVAGVTFGTNGLTLDYDTTSDQLEISGEASVTVDGVTGLEVTFGSAGGPGLVIQDGELEDLNMSVTSSFTVLGVTVAANNLQFSYAAASGSIPATFDLSGSTTVSTADSALSLDVTFGDGTKPGLEITDHTLSSLDMIVTGSFSIDSVSFAVSSLALEYSEATWSLSGGATVTTANNGPSLGVTFGDASNPGLVITGGDLASLNMTVSTSFSVANVSFAANNLGFEYTSAAGATPTNPVGFALSGSTTVATSDDRLSLGVIFGYNSTPGLVIQNGVLTNLDLTVNGNFSVDSVVVQASNLQFTYAAGSGGQLRLHARWHSPGQNRRHGQPERDIRVYRSGHRGHDPGPGDFRRCPLESGHDGRRRFLGGWGRNSQRRACNSSSPQVQPPLAISSSFRAPPLRRSRASAT